MGNGAPDPGPHGSTGGARSVADSGGPPETSERSSPLREVLVLQVKLILEGLKDVLLGPISIGAAVLDWVARRPNDQRLFYSVLRGGERFEGFLNLYGPLHEQEAEPGGPREMEQTVDKLLGWGEHHVREIIAKRPATGSMAKPGEEGGPPPPSDRGEEPQGGGEGD